MSFLDYEVIDTRITFEVVADEIMRNCDACGERPFSQTSTNGEFDSFVVIHDGDLAICMRCLTEEDYAALKEGNAHWVNKETSG